MTYYCLMRGEKSSTSVEDFRKHCGMLNCRKSSHTVSNIKCQIVWITKYLEANNERFDRNPSQGFYPRDMSGDMMSK